MALEWTFLGTIGFALAGLILFITGGLRFRRWVVADRSGIPRYSNHVETIFLWVLYSGVISLAIVVTRQTLREF